MDLPTYTSIWRIEKRLYKLYDFRLPMPVPVGQIAVFAAITVPYVILLTILGLPFNHTLFWLYVLPPGVITWLATRPVLESKRLPELIISQVRYLGEPGTWCRMAPLAEKDDVVIIGKVWHRDEEQVRSPAATPVLAPAMAPTVAPRPARVRPSAARKAAAQAPSAQSPGRVPRAAPAARLRTPAEQHGRAVPWPGVAAGPEGPPSVMAADAPSEIAHDGRQALLRPGDAPAGRHAARAGLPGVAGLAAGDEDKATRVPRPDGLAAPPRPPAAWPAKDPHAPASAAPPAGLAWTAPARPVPLPPAPVPPPVPPAPAPPVSGSREMTAGPVVPAADPVAAEGDPAPVTGDPDLARPGSVFGSADSLAAPETARPAPPAGSAVSVPAQAAAPEPITGMSAGPAGFFIGQLEPEAAGAGRAEDSLAGPEVAEPEAAGAGRAEDSPAGPEVVVTEAAVNEGGAAAGGATGNESAEAAVADPEADGRDVAPGETSDPGVALPAAQSAAPEVLPDDAAKVQPDFPPGPQARNGAPEQDGTETAATPDGLAEEDDRAPGHQGAGDDLAPEEGAPHEDPQGEAAAPGAGPSAPPATPRVPPVVVVRGGSSVRPTLVERALSGPGQHRGGSNWREHVRVVPGGHGPGRPEMERRDRARVLLPIQGPRLVVVLGCTVGAGQTVTTLMLADVLASIRGEPVAALDLNPGQTSLTDMARTSPAATARGLLAGAPATVPGQRGRGRLDLIAHDSAPDGGPALADAEYARVLEMLTSRYPLTLTDPGASAVARVLSAADQLDPGRPGQLRRGPGDRDDDGVAGRARLRGTVHRGDHGHQRGEQAQHVPCRAG